MWDAKFYVGDGMRGGLSRCTRESEDGKQCIEHDVMTIVDPRLEAMICVSRDDLQKLQDQVLARCAKWK